MDAFFFELQQRLDRSNHPIEWIYLCLRVKGAKLFDCWTDNEPFQLKKLKVAFASRWPRVDTVEVVFNHSPQTRTINREGAKRLQAHRGRKSIVLEDETGSNTRWAATQMIVKNLSFERLVVKYSTRADRGKSPHNGTLTGHLYDTEQYLVNLESRHWAAMFRGNRVVTQAQVDCVSVLKAIKLMTHWLGRQVNEEGQCQYKYWPSRGEYSTANNAIRQWMATICINRVAAAVRSEELAKIAQRNLAYNLAQMYREDRNLGYIWLDGSAKLGAAALAGLAILESPDRQQYLKQEYGLRALIRNLMNPDGSFRTFYIPAERNGNQNFYSGEALLFLAQEYVISGHPELLGRVRRAFHYYRAWHLENPNPAFVPWHTQAYFLMWQATRDKEFAEFIFLMNDWLLDMQQWAAAPYPDMQGRFYDPERAHFGPPHASSTGVYLEGLVDAYRLARELGEETRCNFYGKAIRRGIRSILQLQFMDEVDMFYIRRSSPVYGGIRTEVYDNTVRVDNVQHCLMALLKAIRAENLLHRR